MFCGIVTHPTKPTCGSGNAALVSSRAVCHSLWDFCARNSVIQQHRSPSFSCFTSVTLPWHEMRTSFGQVCGVSGRAGRAGTPNSSNAGPVQTYSRSARDASVPEVSPYQPSLLGKPRAYASVPNDVSLAYSHAWCHLVSLPRAPAVVLKTTPFEAGSCPFRAYSSWSFCPAMDSELVSAPP